jgi:hypothetical protein
MATDAVVIPPRPGPTNRARRAYPIADGTPSSHRKEAERRERPATGRMKQAPTKRTDAFIRRKRRCEDPRRGKRRNQKPWVEMYSQTVLAVPPRGVNGKHNAEQREKSVEPKPSGVERLAAGLRERIKAAKAGPAMPVSLVLAPTPLYSGN